MLLKLVVLLGERVFQQFRQSVCSVVVSFAAVIRCVTTLITAAEETSLVAACLCLGVCLLFTRLPSNFSAVHSVVIVCAGDTLVGYIYILLTKREGRIGRISAPGLDSTDRAQRGPCKKDRGPIFSQYGPEQAWLIRDLLHD